MSDAALATGAVGSADGLTVEEGVRLYRSMRVIRTVEEHLLKALKAGTVRTNYYPVMGLEAACAAVGLVLEADDYLVSTYRCTGDVLAKGVPLREVLGEVFGRVTGASRGKGGAMHMSAPDRGFMAATGIVGGGAPIACGLGVASQLQQTGRVTVCTFGDGATSIGAVYEALNLAAVWELPVVFLCQNNQWGEHTSISTYTRNTELSERFAALGMAAEVVDGWDPHDLVGAVRRAVRRAREGGGATFLESRTYRLRPHVFGWDDSYVDQDAKAAGLARDPLVVFRAQLVERGIAEADLAALDAEVAEDVRAQIDETRAEPATPDDEMLLDVFAESTKGSAW